MSDSLTILGRKTSTNVQKVLWTADALGLGYERKDYGGSFGGNRDAPYLALNPNGLVPTLLDGNVVLWESNTICRYLCNTAPPTSLYPLEPEGRADIERWMDWQLGTLAKVITPLYIALVRTPAAERDAQRVDALTRETALLWAIVEQQLTDRPFLAGQDVTLADIAIGPWVYRWFELALGDVATTPCVAAWFERLQQVELFRRHVMIGLA